MKSGLYIGTRGAFKTDLGRIFRVVKRTVRGLFFHETGQRLPSDYEVGVWSDETIVEWGQEFVEEVKNNFVLPLMKVEPTIVGPSTFAYRYLRTERQFASAWLVTFYERVSFLALTLTDPTDH